MDKLIKLEELGQFIASFLLFIFTDYTWWHFLAFILLPDIGMLGYLISTKIGAITYNLFHHKGIALLTLGVGYFFGIKWLMVAGIILFGHAAMDRIFGYGLKFSDSFKHTHLGTLN